MASGEVTVPFLHASECKQGTEEVHEQQFPVLSPAVVQMKFRNLSSQRSLFLHSHCIPPEWTTRNLVHAAFSALPACGQRRILCEWGSETHIPIDIIYPCGRSVPTRLQLAWLRASKMLSKIQSRASVRGHKSEQVSVFITYPTITASLPFWQNRALCTRGQGLNL